MQNPGAHYSPNPEEEQYYAPKSAPPKIFLLNKVIEKGQLEKSKNNRGSLRQIALENLSFVIDWLRSN